MARVFVEYDSAIGAFERSPPSRSTTNLTRASATARAGRVQRIPHVVNFRARIILSKRPLALTAAQKHSHRPASEPLRGMPENDMRRKAARAVNLRAHETPVTFGAHRLSQAKRVGLADDAGRTRRRISNVGLDVGRDRAGRIHGQAWNSA